MEDLLRLYDGLTLHTSHFINTIHHIFLHSAPWQGTKILFIMNIYFPAGNFE